MKKEKVYISAPIEGHNLVSRREFFNEISQSLRAKGYTPVNPMLNGLSVKASRKEHMRADFRMLLDCDKILLCDGWEESQGCQQEATLCLWSGIDILPRSVIEK